MLSDLPFSQHSAELASINFGAQAVLPVVPLHPNVGVGLFTTALPLGAGNYSLAVYFVAKDLQEFQSSFSLSTDYDLQFRLAAVEPAALTSAPEPASLALLTTGLMGAGVRRYRRRRND